MAATNDAAAQQALALIEVDYEVLPQVIDVEDTMAPEREKKRIVEVQLVARCLDDPEKVR